jgi:hypothetical protein
MTRTKINYVKAYRELKFQNELNENRFNDLLNESKALSDKYEQAIEKAKANVELLYEQRGIIGFLEAKIVKLTELLDQKK